MPKYCSVPSCKTDATNENKRKSYYKFPLHDYERLQQWLRNMGREGWMPSRHQYICHEHFTESSFKVSWGIRYLEHNAVPTIFRSSEKRKDVELDEKKCKYRRSNRNLRVALPDLSEDTERYNIMDTLHFYDMNVDPSQSETTLLVEAHEYPESLGGLKTDPPAETFDMHAVLYHTVEGLTCLNTEGNAEVLVVSDFSEVQEQQVNGFTNGQELPTADATLTLTSPCLPLKYLPSGGVDESSTADRDQVTQVIAYFETIPNVLTVNGQFSPPPPETVLSSALGFKPIASTVPIVSKYLHPLPTSLGTGVGTMDAEEEDNGEKPNVDCSTKEQLEEHCYFRSSRLSKEQLEAVVSELQRKVTVLQQRHRRHLDKLLGLESTVSQLRQDNLLHEERLQLLEKAYLQTSAAVSDAGETVAIVYEYESGAFFQSPLSDEDE
ncbi:THAP domain-containing protein 5 [Gadus morhua]|uniref:THAP domain-containing protein 5-like n=1 Tax=Gadus morhua TaxID=8049 RepID=A0A8C5AH51_GADMO|nr:THAP domain-containing protein 5-like [Gadus morhua]